MVESNHLSKVLLSYVFSVSQLAYCVVQFMEKDATVTEYVSHLNTKQCLQEYELSMFLVDFLISVFLYIFRSSEGC